jgi:hypothetical protein
MTEKSKEPAAAGNLASAMLAVQAAVSNPPKTKSVKIRTKEGATFNYTYAELPDILDAVRPILTAHKIWLAQYVDTMPDGKTAVVTRMTYAPTGETIASHYPVPSNMDPHAMGSQITYARRYAICPMLGIAAETDDDGAQGSDAADTAEEERKRQVAERLEEAKKKALGKAANEGRLHSAHDGRQLKADEDPKALAAGATPADAVKVDARLQTLLDRDKITVDQLRAFGASKGLIPADMDMTKLEENFIEACLTTANWAKVKAFTKKG